MAKSKLVKANEKIVEKVTGTYHKVENTFVNGYSKIDVGFVARYLTKDVDSVEEAKKRLKCEKDS